MPVRLPLPSGGESDVQQEDAGADPADDEEARNAQRVIAQPTSESAGLHVATQTLGRYVRPASAASTQESEKLLCIDSPVDPLLAQAFDSQSSASDDSAPPSPGGSARTRGLQESATKQSPPTPLVPYSSTGSSLASTGKQPTGPAATTQEAAQGGERLTIEEVLAQPTPPALRQFRARQQRAEQQPVSASASSSGDSVIPPSPPRASGRPHSSSAATVSQPAPLQSGAVTSTQPQPPTDAGSIVSCPPTQFTDALGLTRKTVKVAAAKPEQMMRLFVQRPSATGATGRAGVSADQPIVLAEVTLPLLTYEFDDDNSRSRRADKLLKNLQTSSDSAAAAVVAESRSTPMRSSSPIRASVRTATSSGANRRCGCSKRSRRTSRSPRTMKA